MNDARTPTAQPGNLAALELKAVLDAAVDAVIIIDHQGRIETFNRAAERLFGYAAADMHGRNVNVLMPEPFRSEHDVYLATYLDSGDAQIIGKGREVVGRRRDGSLVPVALAVGRIAGVEPPRFVGFLHDITDRKRSVEALRRERDRAQAYLDLAEVMLLALDRDGTVTLVNRKGCELLGWHEDELVGRNWFDTCLPEELRDRIRAVFAGCIEGSESFMPYAEHAVLTRQGGTRLIAWRNTVLRDERGLVSGTLSSGEDVTDQRRALEALSKSERLLQEAQQLANFGNFEVRMPTGEGYWSQQMFRLLGLEPSGNPPSFQTYVEHFIHEDDHARFHREWRAVARRGGRFDLEYRLRRRDGAIRDVHAIADLTVEPDGSLTAVGALHDITERKRTEEEIRQSQERLTQFARLSTMGEMAAGLAHEINQPLAAITTYAQAVLRLMGRPDTEPTDVRDALEQIAAQALRAGEVIRRLRSFVKNRETRQETLPPDQLVEEALHFAESDARLNDVRLVVEVEPGLPPVSCDPVQLQQVLINLIRNAIDATNEARPARREVAVRVRREGPGQVEISVEDHGAGIPPEVAAQMGNPFFTTKSSGTGLGVAISRSIVRAHGGKLGHRPTHPAGATVFFTLPVLSGSSQ